MLVFQSATKLKRVNHVYLEFQYLAPAFLQPGVPHMTLGLGSGGLPDYSLKVGRPLWPLLGLQKSVNFQIRPPTSKCGTLMNIAVVE